MRLPVKRVKSAAFTNLRSNPGDETSNVYDPGITSSTSRIVPNSRLKFAQSSCVTPASGSVPAAGLSKNTRNMRALPPPRNSTSTTSSPLEAATRSAISRTRSTSSAMNPMTYWRMAAAPEGLQTKMWAAPQCGASPKAGTQQFSNIYYTPGEGEKTNPKGSLDLSTIPLVTSI